MPELGQTPSIREETRREVEDLICSFSSIGFDIEKDIISTEIKDVSEKDLIKILMLPEPLVDTSYISVEEEVNTFIISRSTYNLPPEEPVSAFSPKFLIWFLPDRRLSLKKPIEVFVEKQKDMFVFYSEQFNITGAGSTKEEAQQDFIDFLIHDYLSFRSTADNKLSREAKELLKLYESFISYNGYT